MNVHLVTSSNFKKISGFFITDEKPKSTFAKVSAICMHTDCLFCGVLPANHYHVLFDVSDVATDFLKNGERFW